MNSQIQAETFKLLCKALERKDFTYFKSVFTNCMLTQSQLLILKTLSQRVGCEISILSDIQSKLDKVATIGYIPTESSIAKTKKQEPKRLHTYKTGLTKKIEIIGFKFRIIRYCVYDHTNLKHEKAIRITSDTVRPGYVCPTCKAIYMNYKDIPIKTKKTPNIFYVLDIQKLVSRLPSSGKSNGVKAITPPIKNTNYTEDGKKRTVYVSNELPVVCACKNTHLESTKNLNLKATSVRFSGKYCAKCNKWYITKETYENLSPFLQSLIDCKPVTWIKPSIPKDPLKFPNPPNPPKKPKPFTTIGPFRSLCWWEKDIKGVVIDSNSISSPFQGTGTQILQVTFGIDFGASTTKVVIRSKLGTNNPSWRALVFDVDFTCEEGSDNTLANSQVYISDTGRIGLGKEGISGWKSKPYFKAILVDSKNNTKDLDEVYYAIFYIATILKAIDEHVRKAYPPAMFSILDLKVAMGMPIQGSEGRVITVFDNILRIADALKDTKEIVLSGGVDFSSWKTLCKETHALQKTRKQHLLVRPELYSEVVGLFNSSYGPTHRSVVIDIGSSTLDIAYVYTEPPIQNYIYIPIAEVAPVGVEVAASHLVSCDCTVFSSLQNAREYLINYPKRRYEDKSVKRLVQSVLNDCIPKIQQIDTEVFGKAIVSPTIPIYFYGGGRDARWFKSIIGSTMNSTKTGLAFTLPNVQNEKIPRVPDRLLHRFQVALGLSNSGEEKKPLRGLPIDYEAFWNESNPPAPRRYVDLEELQRNLYGG